MVAGPSPALDKQHDSRAVAQVEETANLQRPVSESEEISHCSPRDRRASESGHGCEDTQNHTKYSEVT